MRALSVRAVGIPKNRLLHTYAGEGAEFLHLELHPIIACTGPVHWGFVVLELATSLTYDTTYVEMYHRYIFVRACY